MSYLSRGDGANEDKATLAQRYSICAEQFKDYRDLGVRTRKNCYCSFIYVGVS